MADLGDDFKHCDDYIHDLQAPKELRWFLLVNRMPAVDQMLARSMRVEPVLYADFEGKTVRVTMASRMGDVGISTEDLTRDTGYDKRVPVAALSNFRSKP